jgi:hypothetical protein
MTVFDADVDAAADDVTCMICSFIMIDPVQLPYCSHAMCRDCAQRISRRNAFFLCPMRCPLPPGNEVGVSMKDADVQSLPTHTSISAQIQWHAALVLASGFEATAFKANMGSPDVTRVFAEADLHQHLPQLMQIAQRDDSERVMGRGEHNDAAATKHFFEIGSARFDTIGPLESFGSGERLRVSVRRHSSCDHPDAFAIWVERKSSKEQWELEVDDVKKHFDEADTSVPARVVLPRLKVGAS